MTRNAEPKNLSEFVIWLLQEWRNEMPDQIHRSDLFVGVPDGKSPVKLGGSHSTPTDMVGGSLLGTLAYAEPTRRLVEEDDPHHQEPAEYEGSLSIDKHLATPLRSAMRRCGHFMEGYLREVAMCEGDWFRPAMRRGCSSEDIARVYANEAFRRLWREYQVDMPTFVPHQKRPKDYSDDVPWTHLSESQQRAIQNGEAA